MRVYLLILGVLISSICFGQEADSLITQLKKETDSRKKADLMLEISNSLSSSDTAQAKRYLLQAEKLTSKKDNFMMGKIHFTFGQYYFDFNVEKAQASYKRAISFLEKDNSTESFILQARAWHNYGAVGQQKDDDETFVSVLTKYAIPLAKKAGRKDLHAQYLNDLGTTMYNVKKYREAISYYQQALSIIQHERQTHDVLRKKMEIYGNMAESQLYLNEIENADINLDKFEAIVNNFPESGYKPMYYKIRSKYYQTKQDFQNSLKVLNLGLEEKNLQQTDYFGLLYQKAFTLRKLQRYEEAAEILQKFLNENKVVVTKDKMIVNKEMAQIYAEGKNYEQAYKYAMISKDLSDTLLSKERNETILEMETKFRTSEKEKELAVKQLEINKKEQFMWIAVIASLVFLGSGLFTFFYFRNKKKLAEQKEIILEQKLKEKEKEEELIVTKAILDGEERERERVAKDLHDGLGGMLAGVKINLSTWSNSNLEENQYESFHKILNQLDSSVSELRRIARNLMPESLLNFGLEVALQDLCEFYTRPDLQIDFQAIGIERNLPLGMQINIYRIVQELLNNAVKHSGASQILVQCSQSESEFYITVEDNGKGIVRDDLDKVKSLGMKNLKNRIDFLKGNIEIHSEMHEGTSINIELKTNAVA